MGYTIGSANTKAMISEPLIFSKTTQSIPKIVIVRLRFFCYSATLSFPTMNVPPEMARETDGRAFDAQTRTQGRQETGS